MVFGRRPSLATSVLSLSSTSWVGIAGTRAWQYLVAEEVEAQPLMTIGLAAASVVVAVSAAVLIVRHYVRQVLAAFAASEADRDQILAGVHDRIDTTAQSARAELDRSMNWMLRYLTTHG